MGLTACLLIGLFIRNELSYDTFNLNADRIVRVTMEYKKAGTENSTALTGTKPGPEFKRNFPTVEEYVRTYIANRIVKVENKIFDDSKVLYADEPFFNVFTFNILSGEKAEMALNAPDKVILTKTMARKLFGDKTELEKIINQTITAHNKDYRISAICEDAPQNSQLKFDLVTQFINLGNNAKNEIWWTANYVTYLQVKSAEDIKPLESQINTFMNTPSVRAEANIEGNDWKSSYLNYHLEPLKEVHLHSKLPGYEPNGNLSNIYMLAAIGILILIIACANYTNLATAQSMKRAGEIGVRKVMGASRAQIISQFLAESTSVTLISSALALVFSMLLIPFFNHITGVQFATTSLLHWQTLSILFLLTILVSFFAGVYPALVLSGTQIMGVIKKGFTFSGGNNLLRRSLIVLQFAISVFLIIFTIIILQQMNFLKNKNLGYDKDHLVVMPIPQASLNNFENIKNAFLQVPGIESVTASYETPESVGWGDGITAQDEKGTHEVSLNAMPVDLDFTKTLKMEIVAGRDFQRSDFAMMDTSNKGERYRQPFLINENLAAKLGWTPQSAIGKTISRGEEGPILGVVKDFNFTSLHEPIGPLVIFLDRDFSMNWIARINSNDMKGTLSRLESVWKERIPERPFSYHFLDEDYNKLYVGEQRASTLLSIASALAIILASLGLFGLAAFSTIQRTKEIGIRKVLGASVSHITLLIARNFLILVGIAILIAAPFAWYAGSRWLQDFTYRISIHSFVFIITGVFTILIALATISFHAIKAAITNPVKSLRSE